MRRAPGVESMAFQVRISDGEDLLGVLDGDGGGEREGDGHGGLGLIAFLLRVLCR